MFLESRDLELHHANVSCVDDAGRMLGEFHDDGVGVSHPIGACDVPIISSAQLKIRPISVLGPNFLWESDCLSRHEHDH